jgi:hypothetical protein
MSNTQQVSSCPFLFSATPKLIFQPDEDDLNPTQTEGYKVSCFFPIPSTRTQLNLQVGQSKTVAELAALDQVSFRPLFFDA